MRNIEQINKEINSLLRSIDKRIRRKLNRIETSLLSEYKKALDSIRVELSAIYEKYGDNVSYKELNKYKRLARLEGEIIYQVKKLVGISRNNINTGIKTVLNYSYEESIYAFEQGFETSMSFTRLNESLLKKMLDNPFDKVKWKWKGRLTHHHQEAIREIRSEIVQGFIRGKGYVETARAVKEKMNGLANNVVRIVRTESHRVQSSGRMMAIDEAEAAAGRLGIKIKRVIDSVLDDRTRDQSRSMNGQEAGEDGLFTYPNGVKGYPGNTGVAEYDINDREGVVIKIN